MSNSYTTHQVYLESADAHVLIIQFPEEHLNEKLGAFPKLDGAIFRSTYEEYVLSFCLADSSPFFYHVKRSPELMTRFSDIWQELLARVYHYNPSLKPGNIVVTEDGVVKTRKGLQKDEKCRPVEKTPHWNDPAPTVQRSPRKPSPPNPENNPFLGDDLDEITGAEGPFDDTPSTGRGGDDDGHDSLPYELVGYLWELPGLYINVRQYEESEEALVELVGGATFKTTNSYHLLVIQRCVEDWADVITLLEQMGVTDKLEPNQILEELYQIVLRYNPFLRLEDIDPQALREAYQKNHRPARLRRTSKRTAHQGRGFPKKEKVVQKERFSDLSTEALLRLDQDLRQRVIGQEQALEVLASAIQTAAVGLKREEEPLGVFLFAGQTGVGKTEAVKSLAKCLNAHLVRIDCQDYQHAHEVAKLAGSPSGYVGHEDGGHLTNELKKYPFSVVLFDEVEKAHSAFHERLLQIFDDGVMNDNKGNQVSFKEAIIVMTSNIGVREVDRIDRTVGFGSVSQKTEKKVAGARNDALKKKFKPEFLNRIDEVIHFRALEKEDYLSILDLILEEVNQQIKKSKGITLKFNASAKNFLLDNGIDKKFGARPLRRLVKKQVAIPLARAVLQGELAEKSRVNVGFDKEQEKLIFSPAKKVSGKTTSSPQEIEL